MSLAPPFGDRLRAGLAACALVAGGWLVPVAHAQPAAPPRVEVRTAEAVGRVPAARLGPGAWCVHAGAPTVGPPVVDGAGHVVVATTDGYVHSFERHGRYRWSYTLSGAVAGPMALRPRDGTLWVGTTDRQIYSISAQGRLRWRVTTGAPVGSGLVLQSDGSLLYGSGRALYAVTAFGGARWRMDVGARLSTPPVPGKPGITWVAADGELLRVEGAWRLRRLPLPGESVGPPLRLEDGVAVVAGGDLLSFDDDGRLRWSRGDVAAAGVSGRGDLVAVSRAGAVRWFGADGQRLETQEQDPETRGQGPETEEPGASSAERLGAPSSSPQVFQGVAYVPLLSGELVGVDRSGRVVRRWRLSTTPLGELGVDRRGRRLLATVAGGRICSVPLVE